MVLGGERYKVPDYWIYKVKDAPELQVVEDALASKGLRDPWLRNEVWRFLPSEWGTNRQRLLTFFFRGFKFGFGAFLATVAIETAVKWTKGGGDHGGGGGGGGSGDEDGDFVKINFGGIDGRASEGDLVKINVEGSVGGASDGDVPIQGGGSEGGSDDFVYGGDGNSGGGEEMVI